MRPPVERGNIEKVKRNLFGTPTKADRDAFQKTYEETMAEGRRVSRNPSPKKFLKIKIFFI